MPSLSGYMSENKSIGTYISTIIIIIIIIIIVIIITIDLIKKNSNSVDRKSVV